MAYQVKEVDGKTQNTPEPEVVEAVQAEIKKLGDNHKKSYDELRRGHEELKKIIDDLKVKGKDVTEADALTREKLTKFSEDITTRQAAFDKAEAEMKSDVKKFNERLDMYEVRLKERQGADVRDEQKGSKALVTEAKSFFISSMAVRDKTGKGATWARAKDLEIDIEEYVNYKSAFEMFFRKDEKFLSAEDMKALSVGIDPDGGYTVTPATSSRIITRLFEADPIRQLASSETITTGALEWMVDWDQAGYGWEGETVTEDETTTPQWFKKRVPVHTLYAKPRATMTLLEDSGINIESWLADKVSSRFLRGEGAAFVTGDGVNQPRGFESYPDGVNYGQVEQVAMQNATALTADGFIAVKYSLIEDYLTRGTWLMNRLTVADAMYLKDGNGQYIWKPGLADDPAGSTILGLPVRMSTTMPVVAASALSVAIADWREAYVVVDRMGVTVQRDPYTAKPFVEFYTRKRVGGDVTNFQAIKLGIIST
jgi:HK97 family phage major capsid protein